MDEVTFGIETRAAATVGNPTWETLELRRTIARTREEVAGLGLAPPEFETVNKSLEAASAGAAIEKPDRYTVGEHLGEAARALKQAGAPVGAGTGVRRALCRATELLGPAGLATIAPVL